MLCKLNVHGLSKNSPLVVNKSVLANLQTRKIFQSFLFFQLLCFFTSLESVTSNGMIFPPFHVGEKKKFCSRASSWNLPSSLSENFGAPSFFGFGGLGFHRPSFFLRSFGKKGEKACFFGRQLFEKTFKKNMLLSAVVNTHKWIQGLVLQHLLRGRIFKRHLI